MNKREDWPWELTEKWRKGSWTAEKIAGVERAAHEHYEACFTCRMAIDLEPELHDEDWPHLCKGGQHTNGRAYCVEHGNGCDKHIVATFRPLAPARPLGASWCGAQDMAGNVYELTDERLAYGGSFRTDMRETTVTGPVSNSRDDVGFRVALSAI